MALTDVGIRNAKPGEKAYRLADSGGLYVLVQPNGSKWWRWEYRRPAGAGRNTRSFGVHPDVSLPMCL
jgi:hypothetical protein